MCTICHAYQASSVLEVLSTSLSLPMHCVLYKQTSVAWEGKIGFTIYMPDWQADFCPKKCPLKSSGLFFVIIMWNENIVYNKYCIKHSGRKKCDTVKVLRCIWPGMYLHILVCRIQWRIGLSCEICRRKSFLYKFLSWDIYTDIIINIYQHKSYQLFHGLLLEKLCLTLMWLHGP